MKDDCSAEISLCNAGGGSELNNDKNKGVILACLVSNGICEDQQNGGDGLLDKGDRMEANCEGFSGREPSLFSTHDSRVSSNDRYRWW